jgi:hypothetical protein
LKDYEMLRESYIYLFYDIYVLRLSIDEVFPWHRSCVFGYGLEIQVVTTC